jgi:hypothetical protein
MAEPTAGRSATDILRRLGGAGRALILLAWLILLFVPASALAQSSSSRPGVAPTDAWTCPASDPIKGNLTTRTGECIYHVRSGAYYGKTKPERCFATEDEARRAGCQPSKR